MTNFLLSRNGFLGGAVILAQALSLSSAFAVPSDKEAWRSDEHGIIVYRDAVDNDTYWFIPKIRFEAKDNKTILRSKVLANGKTEYTVRIIPYFSKDLKELAAQNISNIRQDSQLKPVIAKTIGISLPDFGFKFASAAVTNFQYLESPRLLKFSLDAEEAATFNELYQDELGVNVDFSLAYDGMMTDKFYNIEVTCKDMTSVLETGFTPVVSTAANLPGTKVFLGADLETAFVRTISDSAKGVNIVSKGDIPGMQEMLRRVMNLCFEPVNSRGGSSYGDSRYDDSSYDDSRYSSRYPTRYPTRTASPVPGDPDTRTPAKGTRGDEIENDYVPRYANFASGGMSNAYTLKAEKAAAEMEKLHEELALDKADVADPDGSGLLPSADLKLHFKYKKSNTNSDNQAVAKQISMKDSTSVIVIPGYLSATQKSIEKVMTQSLAAKKFMVQAKNSASAPFSTGIIVKEGEQWTVNAAFIFNARATYTAWKLRQYSWDSTWAKPDGDLYFRIGNGHWTPVNARSIVESGVIGGGELQFYIDRSALFNKIPEKLRKGSIFVAPLFTSSDFSPEFVVQVSGRRITIR